MALYQHLWKREKVAARTLLLREGAVCDRIYRIRQGCIRAFFDRGDKEICFDFFFEKDIVYAPEREKPMVLQRVPLHFVASYLGITQVSLSRIRSQSRSGI